MAGSQDRNDSTQHPGSSAGEQVPGTRSGEGAASAMQQVMAENERHEREQDDGSGSSHPG